MNKTTFILLITLIISYINTAYIQAQTQRVTVQGTILEKDTSSLLSKLPYNCYPCPTVII